MLKLAVVGAGIMGTHHARIASSMHQVELAYVVDHNEQRARAVAASNGAKAVSDISTIFDDVDACVIALPTALHAPVATTLMERGIHCLVEKPVSTTLDEADRLISLAERAGVTLMVGHVERFNPAILELESLLDGVIHIDTCRVGPFSSRVHDGIVMDLMIHDLDLVAWIAKSVPVRVQSVSRQLRSKSEDLSCALIEFENGVTANLTASRLGQQKIREIRIQQSESFINVDLLRVDVTVTRVSHSEYVDAGGSRYRQSGIVEIPMLEHRGEPLALELTEFVQSISEGRRPRVSGEDGRRALSLAQQVLSAARSTSA